MPDARAAVALALAQRLMRELDQRQAVTATLIARIDALMEVATTRSPSSSEHATRRRDKQGPPDIGHGD